MGRNDDQNTGYFEAKIEHLHATIDELEAENKVLKGQRLDVDYFRKEIAGGSATIRVEEFTVIRTAWLQHIREELADAKTKLINQARAERGE